MFRVVVTFCIVIAFCCRVFAQQEDEKNFPTFNVGIVEKTVTEGVAEGSGTVLYSGASLRAKPDNDSKVLRTLSRSEKVLILGESEDWLRVRTGNRKEGYVNKKYIRMGRIFKDESSTANSMDKKASFEIQDIIFRFNNVLKDSAYAAKTQTVPMLKLEDARKSKKNMTLTFIYSCADIKGNMLPSYRKNDLQNQMKGLLELIFAKLLLTDTEVFNVIIKVPEFDSSGKVLHTDKPYAEIRINNSNIDLEEIKNNVSDIWHYTEITIPQEELFADFPVS